MGVRVLRTPPFAPQANCYCERLIGTTRRECLDFLIPLSGNLVTVPFDPMRLRITGAPTLLANDIWALENAAHFAVSDNGSLAYVPGTSANQQLTWVDRLGTSSLLGGASYHPRIAPDGQRLATDADNVIWILHLVRDTRTRLTMDASAQTPVWSPDGASVIFLSTSDSHHFDKMRADGGGEAERLFSNEYPVIITSWSPDGAVLAYEEQNSSTGNDLWILPLDGERAPSEFLVTEFNEAGARFSPSLIWKKYDVCSALDGSKLFSRTSCSTLSRFRSWTLR